MKKIILEIDESMAGLWENFTDEQKNDVIRQFEDSISQKLLISKQQGERLNEPISAYTFPPNKTYRKSVKIKREIDFITSAPVALNKIEYRKRIEDLTKPLLMDLSQFKFDRDQANNYER